MSRPDFSSYVELSSGSEDSVIGVQGNCILMDIGHELQRIADILEGEFGPGRVKSEQEVK